ncbi:MAG: ABC transporter substrate-binding protein, partial [Nanoarchaeota archaeon]
IVGTVCSSAFLGAAPIAEENKVVMIGSAPSSPEITKSGDYIFRIWPSDVYQARVMADHIKNKEKLDRIALMYTNSDYNIALKNAFKEEFEKLGGKILAEETYEQYSKDFRTQLIKIRERNPDALYIIPYSEGGILLRQIGQMAVPIRVFASETIASKEILADARNFAEGVVYATPKHDKEDKIIKEFLDKYKQRFGKDPPISAATGNAYDSIKLIAEAVKKYGESSDAIKQYLYEIKDYPGAGGKLTIDKNGDPIKEFELMIIKNGKFKKLEGGD